MPTRASRQTASDTDLQVGVSGQVNVQVVLRHPATVSTPKEDREVTELSFWADEPGLFVARARQRLGADALST